MPYQHSTGSFCGSTHRASAPSGAWRLFLFVFFVFVVGVISAAGSGVSLDFVRFIPGADFTGHMAIYGILAFLWAQALCTGAEVPAQVWNPLAWSRKHGLLVCLVMLEEVSQLWWVHRTFSVSDMAANALGLWAGFGLSAWMEGLAGRHHRVGERPG